MNPVADPIFYIAHASSPRMRSNALQLIRQLEEGGTESVAPLLTCVVEEFTDEIIHVYLLDLIDILGLSPSAARLIRRTAQTIRSTMQRLIKALLRGMSNDRLQPLTGYLHQLMIDIPDDHGQLHPYTGHVILPAMRERQQHVITRIRMGQGEKVREDLLQVLLEMVNTAIRVYFEHPKSLLQLSFLLDKMAGGGIELTRGAVTMAVHHIVPGLNDEQLRAVADYMQHLLWDLPAEHYV